MFLTLIFFFFFTKSFVFSDLSENYFEVISGGERSILLP